MENNGNGRVGGASRINFEIKKRKIKQKRFYMCKGKLKMHTHHKKAQT